MNDLPRNAGDARRNHLLAALPDAEWARWLPHLQPVELALGQVLCEAGSTPGAVIFPTSAVVSLMYMTRDGASAEFAVVGREGVVGLSLFMGGDATTGQAVVQGAGQGWRLRTEALRNEAHRAGPVLKALLRYTTELMAQVAQNALCNRFHTIEQQVARRLLLGLDHSSSGELALTQELIASLLGVRREGVTAAATKLQQAGVIRYSRGHIVVLDRRRLEERTCECYAVARKARAPVLPAPLLPATQAA